MWLSMYLLCVCFRRLFWTANADLIREGPLRNLRWEAEWGSSLIGKNTYAKLRARANSHFLPATEPSTERFCFVHRRGDCTVLHLSLPKHPSQSRTRIV
jgi:hypothetical protein